MVSRQRDPAVTGAQGRRKGRYQLSGGVNRSKNGQQPHKVNFSGLSAILTQTLKGLAPRIAEKRGRDPEGPGTQGRRKGSYR
eukprot:661072-Pyramimonas_sp.AAC.1